eukprot:6055394-Prymnesium_polylepis.1
MVVAVPARVLTCGRHLLELARDIGTRHEAHVDRVDLPLVRPVVVIPAQAADLGRLRAMKVALVRRERRIRACAGRRLRPAVHDDVELAERAPAAEKLGARLQLQLHPHAELRRSHRARVPWQQ